jgi:hypothetical protein
MISSSVAMAKAFYIKWLDCRLDFKVRPITKFVFLNEIGFDDELVDEPFAKSNYIHPLPKLVKGHVKQNDYHETT